MAERPTADELAAARARIAELEALEAERSRALAVQAALYRIAEAASAADDLPAFYRTIHQIVGELMYAENLYIALYDEERGLFNYPYYVDAVRRRRPGPECLGAVRRRASAPGSRPTPCGAASRSSSTAPSISASRPPGRSSSWA